MTDENRTARPSWRVFAHFAPRFALFVGAPAAIACACLYGLPLHAVVMLLGVGTAGGLGVTIGFHRLFSHRAFRTSRPVERALMVLGCVGGQSSPIWWIATHRRHHRLSDRPGDPHSPHAGHGGKGWWRRFWHAHQGWEELRSTYDPTAVRDLTRRADLAWIDRHWYAWYLLGLALPAALGYAVGGTAFDALMGFLWGGLLRHAVSQHVTYMINSVGHLWGSQAHDTGDRSRNSLFLGLLALGEGWHNNHHAYPYSARHGFRWCQPDLSWNLIWLMERLGLAWDVKRPKLDAPKPNEAPQETPVSAAHEA